MNKLISFFKKQKKDEFSESRMQLEGDFVIKQKAKGINIKTSLMEYAALERNLKVKRLTKRIILVESSDGRAFAFHNMNGPNSGRVGMYLCNGKEHTRELLKKNGLTVVESEKFDSKSYEQALNYANKIGFPVVVKPTNLSRGRGITTNIQDVNTFKEAWESGLSAYKKKLSSNNLLVEKHVSGEDYRFFVVGNQVISVTHRKRANVVGDGKSTIFELIKKKNAERLKNPYLSGYLIPEDIKYLDRLTTQGLDLESIPAAGEEIILRSQSNISAGGDNIDVTDYVHQDYLNIAIKSVEAVPGIEYGGVDIIAKDITSKPTSTNHIVGEVEFSPAPISHFPYKGKARDMAGAILRHYVD